MERQVALKIIHNSNDSLEREVMKHLKNSASRDDTRTVYKQAIATLENEFDIAASHSGLVMQVMASMFRSEWMITLKVDSMES